MIQWLGFHAATQAARFRSLVRELDPTQSRCATEKKKNTKGKRVGPRLYTINWHDTWLFNKLLVIIKKNFKYLPNSYYLKKIMLFL